MLEIAHVPHELTNAIFELGAFLHILPPYARSKGKSSKGNRVLYILLNFHDAERDFKNNNKKEIESLITFFTK